MSLVYFRLAEMEIKNNASHRALLTRNDASVAL